MAAKQTPALIPLCHPLRSPGSPSTSTVADDGGRHRGDRAHHRPHRRRDGGADRGRRSPALTVDRHGQGGRQGARVITDVRVEAKTGGKSGDWRTREPDRLSLRAEVVVGLQPGRRRGVRRRDRPADRRVPAAARVRGQRPGRGAGRRAGGRGDRRRGRRRRARRAHHRRHRPHPHRPHPRGHPRRCSTPRCRASPRRSAPPASPTASRPPRSPAGSPACRAAAWSSTCPGSRGGVKDGLAVLEPMLRHAVEQVGGSDH